MSVTTSYPGIYIQEAPATSHTIIAAQTNIAVFIGYTHPLKTPNNNLNKAVQIFSFSDYQAQFGGFVRSGAFVYAFGVAPTQPPTAGIPDNPGKLSPPEGAPRPWRWRGWKSAWSAAEAWKGVRENSNS